MTTQCPDNISIPSDALEWNDHSDYWILIGSSIYHNDQKRDLKVNLKSLRVGQTVGCMVSREGELHVYIDGVDKSVVWTGLPTHKPFWGWADVSASTKKIQLVSGEWLLSIAVSHVPHPLRIIFLCSCTFLCFYFLFILSNSLRNFSTRVSNNTSS